MGNLFTRKELSVMFPLVTWERAKGTASMYWGYYKDFPTILVCLDLDTKLWEAMFNCMVAKSHSLKTAMRMISEDWIDYLGNTEQEDGDELW